MDNIVNYYPIDNHLEVIVCDDDGTRVFVIVNTDTGTILDFGDFREQMRQLLLDNTETETFQHTDTLTGQIAHGVTVLYDAPSVAGVATFGGLQLP